MESATAVGQEQDSERSGTLRLASQPGGFGLFVLLGALAAAPPSALSTYIPAFPVIADDLGASTSATQLMVTFYMLGMAGGQLAFGQLSDVFGRRRPLLVGLTLFVVASGLCVFVSSLELLLVGRFFQAFGAASGMVIGRSVVRDLHGMRTSARYYSRLALIYGLGPILAPIAGSLMLTLTSWHGVFALTGAFGCCLLVGSVIRFPETLPAERRRPGTMRETGRTFAALLRHRRFRGCVLTLGLTLAAFASYLSTATFVIQEGYGVSAQLFGLLFGINAVTMMVGHQINAYFLKWFTPFQMTGAGLGVLLTGAGGLMVVALADFGLLPFMLSVALVLGSWGFVQGNMLAIGLADHAPVAGAGSALFGVGQFFLGALVAPLAGIGGGTSPLPLAIVTLTCAVCAAAVAYAYVLRRPRSSAVAAP